MLPPDSILLADDHAAIRMGLRALIGSLWPRARVVEVSDGVTARKELEARPWGLVVLDQGLPGLPGIEVLAGLHPSQPVLIYSMHDSPELIQKARDVGARGFVTKSSEPTELERGLVAVASGKTWFPEVEPSKILSLSARERGVFDLLVAGLGPKEIGVRLSISASSVQTHSARLLAKLQLKSTRDLLRWAADRGRL